jgi:hypothetical protein
VWRTPFTVHATALMRASECISKCICA